MYLLAAHQSYFSLHFLPPKTRFPEYGSVLLIGQFEERNAELESVAVSGEHPCVTTLITAAKETTSLEDETTVLWRYVERFSSLRGSPPPPHPKKGHFYIRKDLHSNGEYRYCRLDLM